MDSDSSFWPPIRSSTELPPLPPCLSAAVSPPPRRDRASFRHMINERNRREKIKQSYATLRSLIPYPTKESVVSLSSSFISLERSLTGFLLQSNKISVVAAAIFYLRRLRERLENQRKRHEELRGKLAAELRVVNVELPTRTADRPLVVDSLVAAVRRLKRGVGTIRTVRWSNSEDERRDYSVPASVCTRNYLRVEENRNEIVWALTSNLKGGE